MKSTTWAIAGMILACILWGSSHAIAKAALDTVPPFLLGALRISITIPVLTLIFFLTKRQPVAQSDRWPMARLSMIGVVASFVFGYSGISLTLSSDAALLIIGEVIFTAILAYFLLHERIERNRLIGIIVGAVGAVVLIGGTAGANTEAAPNRLLGNLLFLACLACESFYTVRGGVFLKRNDSISMMLIVNGTSMIVWIPIIIWYVVNGQFPVFDNITLLSTIYLALVPSVLCYFLWFNAVQHVGATVSAVALLFQPMVGALLGISLMGDPVTLPFIIGGLLIICALVITSLPKKQAVVVVVPEV
ncbi:MAG: DMT family transporter [Chloroflexi bacterium]|nr:DMT family transporter [Chloroflexota bacterium]